MKKLLLVLSGIVFFSNAMAQDPPKRKTKKEIRSERISAMSKLEEEGVVTYNKHTVFGGKLLSDGYGAFIEIGRAKSVRNSLLFQLEIAERKHVKEEKQQINFSTAPIIYGKINYFYPVKLGVQYQHLLGNKGNKNGVSITANVGGGVSMGLLRPYKVDVLIGNERKFVGYESPDSSYYLNGPIVGGPGFGTGWSDLKVTPGIYIKPALRFDYGKFNEMVSAIEVGLTGEFYTKDIPQMIYIDQKKLFLSAYVAILFGRRK
ncbi:MAG: hypothetical protein EOO03_14400 [Chitinophagaceae bacterium]|nr:MAG: hypothetical protein EOO03_14400 [Chitinophagaceae bacterium]